MIVTTSLPDAIAVAPSTMPIVASTSEIFLDRGQTVTVTPLIGSVSVVICTYTHERWDALIEAIASVQRQSVIPDEIIVVVDHNPFLERRLRDTFADVIVLGNNAARGASAARNCGIAAAHGTLVAFLDDDAIAAPDWVACLLVHFTDPLVIGVGGYIAPVWQSPPPHWLPEEFYWVVGCSYRGMLTETRQVRNVISANMCMRRTVLERSGGFRSEFSRAGIRPYGCEETELCVRVTRQWPGHVILYEPLARVWHRVPVSRLTFAYFCLHCYDEGRAKAKLVRTVGAQQGLQSERSYVYRTLPRSVARAFYHGFARGDRDALAQAAAIVVGVLLASVGYVTGDLPQVCARWYTRVRAAVCHAFGRAETKPYSMQED